MKEILPSLEGMPGILHMEDWTEESANIIFEKELEVPEDDTEIEGDDGTEGEDDTSEGNQDDADDGSNEPEPPQDDDSDGEN